MTRTICILALLAGCRHDLTAIESRIVGYPIDGENPSCSDLGDICAGRSCCERTRVIGSDSSMSFFRGHDATGERLPEPVCGGGAGETYPTTLTEFYLDRYEVTVGRFRSFVAAYNEYVGTGTSFGARPRDNDGALLTRNSEGELEPTPRSGWATHWNTGSFAFDMEELPVLPANRDALEELLTVAGCEGATWTSEPGSPEDEARPITCVTWFLSYLFCIYDGGRLPTEAEWFYAAAGGDQQRAYPWSSQEIGADSKLITPDHAQYDNPRHETLAVGSKPLGEGLFGQHDLAGNAFEWVRDNAPPNPCGSPPPMESLPDYPEAVRDPYGISNESPSEMGRIPFNDRLVLGGGASFDAQWLRTVSRWTLSPGAVFGDLGFRCAYDSATHEGL